MTALRRIASGLASVAVACAGGISATSARPAAAQADPAATFEGETSVEWVLVPVTVKDQRGGFVTDLARRHFNLRIDGRTTHFETFDAEAAAPISLIHLQDLSGSMAVGGKIEVARAAIDCILDALRPHDEIAVASFSAGQLAVDVPFTSTVAAAHETAATWDAYGTTALHDAVAWLPEIGLEGRFARRAAVLLTDGADNASTLDASTARDMVRRARLPVYVLAIDTPREIRGKRRGKKKDDDLATDRDLLEALAESTGGRFFAVDASADAAEDACRAITAELRHQYVLGFKIADDRPTEDRRLEVEVAHARTLIVTHRASYRGALP